MTPYLWRLCCLSLASLFVVQIGAGLILRSQIARLLRWAGRFEPARAAAIVLGLRWMPALAGWFVVGLLCIPSYLRLEPAANEEEIGLACFAMAGLVALSYIVPLLSATADVIRSEIRLRALVRTSEQQAELCVIRDTSPPMAFAGLFHSRVLVSREVMGMLTADQMDAALRHERAHFESRDNYKRLLLELAPLDCAGRKLRSAWSRFTEWAADDRATEGDSARSVALASALVSVARLGSKEFAGALLLVPDGCELRARVERLLEPSRTTPATRYPAFSAVVALGALALALAAIAQQPAAAEIVHRALETFID
jgi:Zn-dependent protease with chaperone function